MRILLLAALMASATIVPAFAQRADNAEIVADSNERQDAARAEAQSVAARVQLAQRSERGLNRAQDGDGGNWRNRERADPSGARSAAAPAAPPQAAPPQIAQRGDGGWQGRRGGDGQARGGGNGGNGGWQGRRGGDWQARSGGNGSSGSWQQRGDGGFDRGRGNRAGGQVIAPPAPGSTFDRNGNGRVDRNWDRNGNGVVDRRFDRNRDNTLDRRFDRNGNGVVDPRFDRNGNGVVDRRFDRNRGGGQVIAPPVPGSTFDRNGNGRVDRDWDRNRNGVVDRRFDRNRDNVLDRRFDRNRNGVVDPRFDRNRDGRVDPRFGRNDRDWRGNGWNNGYGDRGFNDWNNRWNRGWRGDRRFDWYGWRNQNRNIFRAPRYIHPFGNGFGYRRFGIGVYLDQLFFNQSFWINDPFGYRLPPAPFGARWVRYYDDVLLVDIRSGFVIDVIYDFFW